MQHQTRERERKKKEHGSKDETQSVVLLHPFALLSTFKWGANRKTAARRGEGFTEEHAPVGSLGCTGGLVGVLVVMHD